MSDIMRVIAVTGGKGGIGKTNIALNLAVALGSMSQKVMLLDADMGLANIDVLLDLKPKQDLSNVLANECHLQDVILKGPNDISVIPASSGNQRMAGLNFNDISGLIHRISELEDKPNTLIIDTAAGIANHVVGLSMAANEVLVVVCNEPTSITDAYAVIKLLNTQYHINKFRVIANKVRSKEESREVFAKLTKVADKFLNVSLQLVGGIPEDRYMERAVRRRKSVVDIYPNSKSAIAFNDLARKVLQWPLPCKISGRIDFNQMQLNPGFSA